MAILYSVSRHSQSVLIYLYIFCFMSHVGHLYRLYCDGWLEVQRKPVHTVGQGSVLQTADQQQVTTSFFYLRSGRDSNSDLRGW